MKTIQINPADNVAVAIEAIAAGTTVNIDGQDIVVNNDVPADINFSSQTSRKGKT